MKYDKTKWNKINTTKKEAIVVTLLTITLTILFTISLLYYRPQILFG